MRSDEFAPSHVRQSAYLGFWDWASASSIVLSPRKTLTIALSFAPAVETLALHDLARQPGSPGRLFKIDESSLVERLEGIERATDGKLSWSQVNRVPMNQQSYLGTRLQLPTLVRQVGDHGSMLEAKDPSRSTNSS